MGPANLFPGEFVFKSLLGEGAFGKVWLAEDVRLRRPVAMKTVRLPADSDRELLRALENEAQLLARISHPNVVQVYAWRSAGGENFLVLQYVPGGSLAARLQRDGPLSWHLASRYVSDVADGLLAVHRAGIVHRDIKPENILWDPERDEALLTDFGISRRLVASQTVAGTPLYMAPEMFDGRACPASDVYSLSATLFRLITGQLPFSGASVGEVRSRIAAGLPVPDPRCQAMPEEIERLIRAGLAADADSRPALAQMSAELRAALNRLLADSLVQPSPAGSRPPVKLEIRLARCDTAGRLIPIRTSRPGSGPLRDMQRVPARPEQLTLRTGDRVRITVAADRDGYLTVFNIGPSGNLNVLCPDEADMRQAGTIQAFIRADQSVDVTDVEMTPPTGRERLAALWTRLPVTLRPSELRGIAGGDFEVCSPSYYATRDMKRLETSLRSLAPDDWHVAVLELNHC